MPQLTPDHTTKLQQAIGYLRERKLYRGDLDCDHLYTPVDPEVLQHDSTITVTVCRVGAMTVNHATRGLL